MFKLTVALSLLVIISALLIINETQANSEQKFNNELEDKEYEVLKRALSRILSENEDIEVIGIDDDSKTPQINKLH